MADSVLIPPVAGNPAIPERRTPARPKQNKHNPPGQNKSRRQPRPSGGRKRIDEFA